MIRYDAICYFNARSKADARVNLIYRTELTKKWKTEQLKSKKPDMLRSIGKQSRGIRGVKEYNRYLRVRRSVANDLHSDAVDVLLSPLLLLLLPLTLNGVRRVGQAIQVERQVC